MNTVELFSIFGIALVGSFGHCIGMCGGIVIAYTSTKTNAMNVLEQSIAHLSYSFGRLTTYVILGASFGFLGSVVTLGHVANGVLYLLAGVFMVLAGLSIWGKLPFLNSIEASVYKYSWYKKTFGYLIKSKSFKSFYALGMLNGILPCGFVYVFVIRAASTADPLSGAIIMGVFALATIPALFSLGFFVGTLSRHALRNSLLKVASLAVILYGIYTTYKGIVFFTDPTSSLLNCH